VLGFYCFSKIGGKTRKPPSKKRARLPEQALSGSRQFPIEEAMLSTRFYPRPRSVAKPRAFSIMEVVLSLVILMFMVLMVAAVIPASLRNTRYSSDFSQAASLAQHKVNQLQDAGYMSMTGPILGQSGLKLVDGNPGNPANNTAGDQSATFEFTNTDRLWQYFNGGMDEAGNQIVDANSPHGYLYIAPYTPSVYNSAAGSAEYGLIRATVTIQWWTSKGNMQSFSTTTLIPRAIVN
jgi:type II secretory pathway pseudopilin PulG